MLLFNTNRITELLDEEKIHKAANALIRLPSAPVLKALAAVWGIVLVMVFTLLFTVRLALSIPL